MSSSLSSLVDNLSGRFYNNECTNCDSCLDYTRTKNNTLFFKCFKCKGRYRKDFDEDLIKVFASIYEFCDRDINKFILLLRKGIYPYEYMDSWGRSDDTVLPNKKEFYSKLNLEDITDNDDRHAKKVFKNFNNKNLGDYHYLYVQNDSLLLADIFENFRNKCIEIYELDPAHFKSEPGLVWQSSLKKINRIRIID